DTRRADAGRRRPLRPVPGRLRRGPAGLGRRPLARRRGAPADQRLVGPRRVPDLADRPARRARPPHRRARRARSSHPLPARDRAAARSLADAVRPRITDGWDRGAYPTWLIARLGELDLLTDGLDVPGHRTLSPLATGLVNMELSRIDGSVGTMVGVQGGLALRSIMLLGSEKQTQRWAEPLATGAEHAAFALTEPDHGSDSVSLETVARRDGDEWVLTGQKRWIGNGAGCDLSVVWARVDDESQP